MLLVEIFLHFHHSRIFIETHFNILDFMIMNTNLIPKVKIIFFLPPRHEYPQACSLKTTGPFRFEASVDKSLRGMISCFRLFHMMIYTKGI